ncbi:MAG: NADH-quinone oxidoreductase subunit L [Alphaproteobacteria bacterium CG_4_10_14_0_2_um_filter_63_37]|nr:MAG: NADH-quinone oxidoreductase subunit L [Proteobacteria bacterium CG1_02_64_396]PJA24021.1 MAG: NADH-quinone oxidoreductase subunit L [Alphaproteobacteria bacterium CG_4_10_14_0_2_um_filter_63_37]
MSQSTLYLLIPLIPLLAGTIVGLFGSLKPVLPKALAHWLTCGGMGLSAILAWVAFFDIVGGNLFHGVVYTWAISGDLQIDVAFLADRLTAVMLITVTTLSFFIHVYTIGYMEKDPGYARFFSYISLFTFFMLILVLADNFLVLFFGWEGVGLVSYLLIGFWYKRESANYAAFKAFIVNRVGDFGLALGIMAIYLYFGTLEYSFVFEHAAEYIGSTVNIPLFGESEIITAICLLLFVGAMGKSAQVPLHVWLPDSMEGPTPISALIHAATMVTAGVFLVARCSPMFELSQVALDTVAVIGALTAFLMAAIGLVQNDIKRVIAYSTCSQLGYMFFACGVSAYAAGIFHLMAHGFFKALLFLGAGSVIHAMSDEQDMRKMGGLRKYMPFTFYTFAIASLALAFAPSKEVILASAFSAHTAAGQFAWTLGVLAALMTAFYTFRMLFMTFWGSERMDEETKHHLHESPKVITVPLVILAVGALLAFYFGHGLVEADWFGEAIVVAAGHEALEHGHHLAFGLTYLPALLGAMGIALAYYMYVVNTALPGVIATVARPAYELLQNKYYWDELYVAMFMVPSQRLGSFLAHKVDMGGIDRAVDGMAAFVGVWAARQMGRFQTGLLYQYAFVMILGLFVTASYFVFFHHG